MARDCILEPRIPPLAETLGATEASFSRISHFTHSANGITVPFSGEFPQTLKLPSLFCASARRTPHHCHHHLRLHTSKLPHDRPLSATKKSHSVPRTRRSIKLPQPNHKLPTPTTPSLRPNRHIRNPWVLESLTSSVEPLQQESKANKPLTMCVQWVALATPKTSLAFCTERAG